MDKFLKVRSKEVASHGIVARWHCFRFFLADLIILGWRTVGAAEAWHRNIGDPTVKKLVKWTSF